jgi:molybdopterin-guanine dinucleotide biosynthesis protein A
VPADLRLEKNADHSDRVAGYVTAGGASRRFGSDKALVEFGGKTLLSRMCDLVKAASGSVRVIAPRARYADRGVTIVEDRWPDEGPLGGIITGLLATENSDSKREWNLIVSCDMPFLTLGWLEYLCMRTLSSDAEVVVPQSAYRLEPLCACWRTAAAALLRAAFDENVRKVTEAMKRLRMEVLDETHWKRFDSAGQLFWNMNTPQDYESALRTWGTGQT